MGSETKRWHAARFGAPGWLLVAAASLPALAQQVDVAAGASSSLMSRGILLGRNEPSLQASAAYYAAAGGYVGVSAATLRLESERDRAVQLAARAGWLVPLAADWVVNLGVQHIAYPFDSAWSGFAYDEADIGVAYADLAVASVSVLRHPDDYAAGSRTSMALDLVGRYPLRPGLALTAGLGWHDLQQRYGFRYVYGHAGVGWRAGRISADLAYTLTDAAAKARYGSAAADRWTASLLWHF